METQNPEPKPPEVSEVSPAPEPPEDAVVLATEREQLIGERDQIAAEKADLADRLLRARAEFDNFRRRVERDRSRPPTKATPRVWK